MCSHLQNRGQIPVLKRDVPVKPIFGVDTSSWLLSSIVQEIDFGYVHGTCIPDLKCSIAATASQRSWKRQSLPRPTLLPVLRFTISSALCHADKHAIIPLLNHIHCAMM